jgi:hypothetical protein
LIEIVLSHFPIVFQGDLLGMSADRSRDMGRDRLRYIRCSGSPEILPKLRPGFYPRSEYDFFEGCPAIGIPSEIREDVLLPRSRFAMKLEQLPFDVREERNNSKLPVFVMLRLTGIDDEDPSLLEGDMLPLKPLRFAT